MFLRALNEREQRILVLVCAGWSNARIAERLSTSEQCVKNCMRLIMQKAGKRSRFELIVFAFGSGTVECPCKLRSRRNAPESDSGVLLPPGAGESSMAPMQRAIA